MKLTFVHDHIFYKYKDLYYSTGSLPGEALERYIKLTGNVTIVARSKSISEINKNLTLSSIPGTTFVTVPNHKSLKTYHNVRKVHEIIKNEIKNSDYIIARSSTLGNIAVKYAKRFNKPYLIEVVGCQWDSLWNHSWKGKIMAPFSYYNFKRLVYKAPYVLYVTSKFLQERYPTKGKTVNCSNVVLERIDEQILYKRIEKIKKYKMGKKIILGTIGAVDVKYKGQQSVIKALGKLKTQGFNNFEYQLIGAGDNSYLKSLAIKNKVEDQVKFLGVIKHSQVFDWLDNIDLYIQPSKTEGLPRSLVEAMSRGLPAIGTSAGGIPELLDDNFIISNSRNNIEELIKLLINFDKNILIKQAIRNFEVSKEYRKNIIEMRRDKFLKSFVQQN